MIFFASVVNLYYFMVNQMNELVSFWFSKPNLWFNCTTDDDKMIKDKYESLLLNQDNYSSFNKENLLGLILLNDQISRHIFRNNKSEIKKYDAKAFSYSFMLLDEIENYKPEERCFILMPLRHTFSEIYINICLEYINKWRKENDLQVYTRFYQATITSLSNINNQKETLFNENNDFLNNILDEKSTQEINFIDKNIKEEKLFVEFKKNMDKVKINDNIILSISGGVDSMVCSYLLYYYTKNIKCVTINYNNREDQHDEIKMVNKWLTQLNMEHHVRTISEIKRTRDGDREFYERITRNIRFNTYKKFGTHVILGHNRDDSLENIFSNIKKKISYDNLFGMDYVSTEQDVTILRPLLNISKVDILNFANKYNIPFVQDSTPKWSERGRMRDILIPQINNFDKDIIDGLICMVNNFKEIYSIYHNFIPKITFNDNSCYVEDSKIYFFDYWKNILIQIAKHYGIQFIKNKSIQNMLSCLQLGNRITLSKNVIVKLEESNIIFYINK